MKSLFIVNPRSGVRRKKDIAAMIRDGCAGGAASHEIASCDGIDQLDGIISRAKSEGFEVVYAVGGDGTVHEIARRVIGTALALGIVPAGSGNGLARHLGIPLDIERAVLVCQDGVIATIDSAVVNGHPFFGVMGVGLDAVIAERFAASRTRGLRTYVRMGLRTFIGFRPEDYEIEIDGVAHRPRAHILAIANSSQYGNNARIAPLASLQDGLLDVVIIEDAPMFAAPLMLVRLFNGTLHQSRGVRILQGRNVHIRRSAPGAAHLDGEPILLPAELNVSIRPASLRVMVPRARTRI
jgi:YegS/Rv2252/BmrU family lipid kinase